jgi:hypothetical protein
VGCIFNSVGSLSPVIMFCLDYFKFFFLSFRELISTPFGHFFFVVTTMELFDLIVFIEISFFLNFSFSYICI